MSERWSWERCAETAQRLFSALDWRELGRMYFHADGEARWAALVPRVLTLGEDWARALLRRLPASGHSLHVGAGIAELPVLLAERFVRGRDVTAVNLRVRECELIEAGMRRCGLAAQLPVEPIDGAIAAARGGFDHLGCVSVFTDPNAWPLVSAVAYGRIAPVQLDLVAFAAERERAVALVGRLLDGLRLPAWISSSVDEVPWFLDQARRRGIAMQPDEQTMPTAVVGDPIGFLRVAAAPATAGS